MLELKKKALTRIPKGVWKNVYHLKKRAWCLPEMVWRGPGRVVGRQEFVSKELAEEWVRRYARLTKNAKYLGAKFFPTK